MQCCCQLRDQGGSGIKYPRLHLKIHGIKVAALSRLAPAKAQFVNQDDNITIT